MPLSINEIRDLRRIKTSRVNRFPSVSKENTWVHKKIQYLSGCGEGTIADLGRANWRKSHFSSGGGRSRSAGL